MVGFPVYTGITISPTSATLYDDGYVNFTILAHYSDGSSTPYIPALFRVDDRTVATVSNQTATFGRVYGVAPGTATLTVQVINEPFGDPLYSATAALTVTEPPPPPPPPAARFSLAFGSVLHDPYPTWTALDTTHPNLVTSYTIDRGRSYELDQTDVGRATVTIQDPDGILDPTNPTGPYYGQIRPLLQAAVCRYDPVTETWQDRFHGYIEDYAYDVHPSQVVNQLTVSLVDLFEPLGVTEMQPGMFGTTLNGQVVYDGPQTGFDLAGNPVYAQQRPDQRIAQVLQDAGFARRTFVTLHGAVGLHRGTYSPGEPAMSVIQDAANAEFPNVANVYVDRHGRLTFHGRAARFDPAGTAASVGSDVWDYHDWKAGDHAAITASPSDTAQVRALSYERGLSKLINAAVALPTGAPDDAETTQRVTDPTSISTYGIRSWSSTNLMTAQGDLDATYPTSALTETKRFAQFYVSNYAQPHDRITTITFRSLHPTDPRAPANWQLLTKIDIGDTLELTVMLPGGGGFTAQTFFVEGVHEEAKPLEPGYDDVTLSLDLSPRTYYTANPWTVPLTVADIPDPPVITDPGPTMRSAKPKPLGHAGDHKYGGADPIRIVYEKVGAEAGTPGDGGGGGPEVVTFSISGDLEVANGGLRYYPLSDGEILQVWVSVGTAPAGSSVTVRLNLNGSSIGTTSIAAGSHFNSLTPSTTVFTATNYFTVDVTAVGGGTPGADLVLEIQVA